MAIITISRELGSGGTDVARLVAEALGYRLVDRELVDMVAARLGVSRESAYDMDERSLDWFTALVDSLVRSLEGEPLTMESYRYVSSRVLRQVAREGNAVILGRAGQVVLAKMPNTTHVHIAAPLSTRIERIQNSRRISETEARRIVEESDSQRRGYILQVAQKDWSNLMLYDLMINTNRLSIEQTADLVLRGAHHRGAKPATSGH